MTPICIILLPFFCFGQNYIWNIDENLIICLIFNKKRVKKNCKKLKKKNVKKSKFPWRGTTIRKIFFSRSARTYLINAQPEPISVSVTIRMPPWTRSLHLTKKCVGVPLVNVRHKIWLSTRLSVPLCPNNDNLWRGTWPIKPWKIQVPTSNNVYDKPIKYIKHII